MFEFLELRVADGMESAEFGKVPHQILTPVTTANSCYVSFHLYLPPVMVNDNRSTLHVGLPGIGALDMGNFLILQIITAIVSSYY